MKRKLIIGVGFVLLIGLVTLIVSFESKAGLWDSLMTGDWEEKAVDSYYNLSVYGFDARAYEWTPNSNPNMTCVFIASNENSGVGCFKKVDGQ